MTPETHHAYPIPAPWAQGTLQSPSGAYRYGVWYSKDLTDGIYAYLQETAPVVKLDNFAYLGDITADALDGVFMKMQGELWSPNGEARDLIRSLGLTHTSMSVGDLIADYHANKFYMVMPRGFEPVTFVG